MMFIPLPVAWVGRLGAWAYRGFRAWRTARAARNISRAVNFSSKQLQSKFKHAADFGIKGNYNPANAARFQSAIQSHVFDPSTKIIQGTYRGQSVIHYVNPATGINVMTTSSGQFISGWTLNPAQLTNVLARGSL